MKTFGLIVCNIAIALGIWVGRGDYLRERDLRRAEEALRLDAEAPATGRPAQLAVQRQPGGRRSSPAASGVTDDMLVPLQRHGEAPEAPEGSATLLPHPGAGPTAEAFAPTGRLKARFDEASDALRRLDFEAAETQALAIAQDPREGTGLAREKALQLAAKSRAFRRILTRVLGSSPAPAAPKTKATLAEVLLANGSRFEARLVEERPDRFVFKLGTGGTFSPRREDVVELKRVEKEVSSGPDWNELQPKIAALDHPVDLFVDGVERCFRLGLKREGMQVLERLLGRADSDQVPLLFAADADETLLSDWQIAAGRKRSTPEARRIAAAPPRGADTGEEPQPGARSAAGAGADQEALLQAQGLVNEAQGLYQAAVGQEGKGENLRQARDKLQSARRILEELPEAEPAVKALRRAIAQLTSDVARVSPF